jgi:hypothetical protein
MSLIAWYPLNGDTKDYSGNGLDATNSGASIDNSGKIGKCYSFNGGSNYITAGNPTKLQIKNEITLSAWINPINVNALGNVVAKNGNSGFRFRIDAAQNLWWYVSGNPCTGGFVPLNTWTHCLVTGNQYGLKCYVNGFMVASNTTPFAPTNPVQDLFIGALEPGAEPFYGKINDVRIYDHTLSEKEIKELAKAKVLHYTFNDFQEPTTNLWVGNRYEYNNNSTVTRDTLEVAPYKVGYEVAKIQSNTPGTNGESILWTTPIPSPVPGEVYTHSAYIMLTAGTYVKVGQHWNPWDFGVPNYIPLNTWVRVSYTLALVDNTHPEIANQYSTDGTIYVTMPQYEKKNHSTPFVFGARTGIVHDISGYKNDAILSESTTPTWTTGRLGTGGYLFPGLDKSKIYASNNWILNSYTISFWALHTSGGKMPIGSCGASRNSNFYWYGDSSWRYVHGGVGGEFYYPKTASITPGTWGHYCATYNGVNVIIYRNGIFEGAQASSGIADFTTGFSVGYGYGSSDYDFQGNIDDVRFYASALDAADVLEIYQTRASLDDKGNLFVNEVFERENLIRPINDAVIAKTFTNGVSSYQQVNCICTINSTGYNVYRPANKTFEADGYSMWGGVVLEIPEGTFIEGKNYVLKIKYNGVSSNGITEFWFEYVMGYGGAWGGTGVPDIITSITTDSNRFVSLDTNGKWENMSIFITPTNAKIYTVATNAYGAIAGQTYYAARQFKIGHGYQNTGPLGTNLTYKDFRLYDITDGAEKEINLQDTGKFVIDQVSEVGITDGLVGWWKLNGDAKDYSGNGYDGVVTGAVVTSGLKDKAYSFNGSSYINLNSGVNSIEGLSQGTISLWFNASSSAYLFSISEGTNGNNFMYVYVGDATGAYPDDSISFLVNRDGLTILGMYVRNGHAAYTNNVWTHFAVSTGNGNNLIYINGVAQAIAFSNGNTTTNEFSNINGQDSMRISGMRYANNETGLLSGSISDTRIYNRALSEDEINIIYKQGTPGTGMQISSDGTLYLNKEIKEGF